MTEFGAEAVHLERSLMRALMKAASAPDVIPLAGGLPANDLLPVAALADCIDTVLRRDGAAALQYGPQYEPLREWIAESMRARGVACDIDNVSLTNGAQQGLAILSRLLLNPAQIAVTEEITFTGIQQVTAGRGAVVRTVPTNLNSGVDVEAFEAALAKSPRPRLAILIPDFHNPLGVSVPRESRAAIAMLAARHGAPVIEDDPYSALRFDGDLTQPLKAFDDDGQLFYVGSFSKILAPAVRLGWIVAPRDLQPTIQVVRESFDLESSAFVQRAVFEFLDRGLLDEHLARLRAANRERCETLLGALHEHLGGIAQWTRPTGGLFVWVTLPTELDAQELFGDAIEQKVAFVPGSAFAVDGGHANTMRLNFSNAAPAAIRIAVERLAQVIHTHLQTHTVLAARTEA